MSDRHWFPWNCRRGLRIPVARLKWSDWAGSEYEFAKDANCNVVSFWTRKGAQEYSDSLNAAAQEIPMPNRDWLLANHIRCASEGIGRTSRKPSLPSILRTIAIFALAVAIGIAAVR